MHITYRNPRCAAVLMAFYLYPKNLATETTMGLSSPSPQIIKAVMSSAAEAKLGALYINFREAIPARHTLIAMGHLQPPTSTQTDNTTALRVVNNTIAPRRTKAMGMRFHWLRFRKYQQQFCHYWQPGPTNNGDYLTKHHAAVHH